MSPLPIIVICLLLIGFILFYFFNRIPIKLSRKQSVNTNSDSNPNDSSKNNQEIKLPLNSILFSAGESVIDNIATERLEKLSAYLNSKAMYQLKLTGLADQSGNQATNRKLARQRVEKTKQALIKLGISENLLVTEIQEPMLGRNAKERQQYRSVRFEVQTTS
jgi:outer membrane protein OmpA-like peptidoglycan-associated protein